jgi:hypothetical protein
MAAAKKDKAPLPLGIRLSADDSVRLDGLAERLPIGTRHGVARVAFRIGREIIENDPGLLLGTAAEKRRAKR